MRLYDGSYECNLCGAVLAIPLTANPVVMLTAARGEPNIRLISYDGEQIHACPTVTSYEGRQIRRVIT